MASSFSMLPVRTGTGRVIKQKQYDDLLKAGVSTEDAKNIVLGKSKRNWADAMSYMTPVIYRGFGDRKEGIVRDLMEPGLRNPKIRGRVIHLTGSDYVKDRNIKNDNVIKNVDAVSILSEGSNGENVEIMKGESKEMFDLDELIDDIGNLDIDFVVD